MNCEARRGFPRDICSRRTDLISGRLPGTGMTYLSQHVKSSAIFGKYHKYYLPRLAKTRPIGGYENLSSNVGMRDGLENNSIMAGELDVYKYGSGLAPFVLRIVTRGRKLLLLPFYLQSRSTESDFCHWFSRPISCKKQNVPDLALSSQSPAQLG